MIDPAILHFFSFSAKNFTATIKTSFEECLALQLLALREKIDTCCSFE